HKDPAGTLSSPVAWNRRKPQAVAKLVRPCSLLVLFCWRVLPVPVYVDPPAPSCIRGGKGSLRKEVKNGARDPHRVRAQYEDYWGGVLDHARRIVASEPGSLTRAVNLCLAAHAERPRKIRWIRGRRMAAILVGQPLPPRLSPRCIDMITRVTIGDLVTGYCNPDTECIIELGSGWGANLFHLWLSGAPRKAAYVAPAYTESG